MRGKVVVDAHGWLVPTETSEIVVCLVEVRCECLRYFHFTYEVCQLSDPRLYWCAASPSCQEVLVCCCLADTRLHRMFSCFLAWRLVIFSRHSLWTISLPTPPTGLGLSSSQVILKFTVFLLRFHDLFEIKPDPNVSLAKTRLKTCIWQTSKRTKRAFVKH